MKYQFMIFYQISNVVTFFATAPDILQDDGPTAIVIANTDEEELSMKRKFFTS